MNIAIRDSTIRDAWDGDRVFPYFIYIETTNYCNAHCLSCLHDRCVRTRGIMTLDDFKTIADKIKARGFRIGAMFCYGEPLMDPTLIEKFAYAHSIDVFAGHIGFNTNVTFLTPEKYDGILAYCPNITLSFFNTHGEFERLTGGLKWDKHYKNAIDFIKYRDAHVPNYPIFIGVNKVSGHSLENVKQAFTGYNVVFVQDAELRWGGRVMTGIEDRTIMFHEHRCDGHKGALQIKYNGNCEFCAYDIIGTPTGGETLFANIFIDSWEEIDRKFKKKWRDGCSLCLRCDNWHHIKTIIANNFQKPNPLPPDWNDWQKPYLSEGEAFCV